ncbi:hypothetical protein [Terrimonas ferruginea]|uniref:hypothetical protein n=1 Tax=Terrimonas ferruginea TaxID=249 RepID=UPI000429A542|nr:hypothetical protein [Terrimonas ferruginea]
MQLKLENSWERVKERLKENNIQLTDDDLHYTPGQDRELIDRLAKKLGKDPHSVKEYVESISANEDKAG